MLLLMESYWMKIRIRSVLSVMKALCLRIHEWRAFVGNMIYVILGKDGSFLGRQLSMGWKEGLLYYPTQMCINEKREVFIADGGNSRIQIFMVVK
jgi:hypothetical protein